MPIRSTGHRSTGRAHPSGGAARKSARYDDLAGTTGWNSRRNRQLQNALVLDGSFRLDVVSTRIHSNSQGSLLRRAEAFGTAPDQLPDPSPYEGRKRRSAGLKNPRQSGMSRRWLKQRTKAASRSPPPRDLNYSEASSLSFGGRRMNFPSTGKAIRSAL